MDNVGMKTFFEYDEEGWWMYFKGDDCTYYVGRDLGDTRMNAEFAYRRELNTRPERYPLPKWLHYA